MMYQNKPGREEEPMKMKIALPWLRVNRESSIGDNWVLSPVILPIYSPETEFALVLGGLATWSTRPGDTNVPRSTISSLWAGVSARRASWASTTR